MYRSFLATAVACSFVVCAADVGAVRPAEKPDPLAPVFNRYCVTCHNDRAKTGGLTLQGVTAASVAEHAPELEKAVRKLRIGAMPPAGAPRPDAASMSAFVTALETGLDQAASSHPNVGRTESLHRLNRSEYRNAIRDLLDLDIDPAWLPSDESSFGFDNIAGVEKMSPVLMERYQTVAQKVSRLAVGAMSIPVSESVFRLSSDVNQDEHFDGLPLGTRGGMLVHFDFPLDGEYEIRLEVLRDGNDFVPVYNDPHLLEVSIDGERRQVFTFGEKRQPRAGRGAAAPAGPAAPAAAKPAAPAADNQAGRGAIPAKRAETEAAGAERGFNYRGSGEHKPFVARIRVSAGPHDLAAAFLKKSSALTLTQRDWFVRPVAGIGDTRYEPQLGTLTIAGPFNPTGPGETPSRTRIFSCRPSSGTTNEACASGILSTLARRAFRRPVTQQDVQPLLAFFSSGAAEGNDFEHGIELALERLLISPQFLFRIERDPAGAAADSSYYVSDLELASRLSFFLWSSIPDDELLKLAETRKLHTPEVLRQQVRRMLADRRSDAFVSNFPGQWLYLRNVPTAPKDGATFPDFEGSLRQDFRKETELFFSSVLHDDHASALTLLTADYTFVNERLAKYYGIPDVYGHNFRRVSLADNVRGGGLLSQGSILLTTSYPTRTSPVIRGKWILSNILGVPPPDPPPNVPALQESVVGQYVGVTTSVRQRLETHRASPACSGCHKVMDPIGLAMDNFDAVGRWRTMSEVGTPLDTASVLFDGTPVDSPATLRAALLKYSDSIVRTMAEKLLVYSLGRGTEYYDAPTIRRIVREAGGVHASLQAIITGIVESEPFRMRRAQS
jgi:hypothetical protein